MSSLKEDKFMWYEKYFSILSKYFNNDRILKYASGIYENDRWFTFSSFIRTAEYCAEQMRQIGLEEVEMIPLKADGHTPYGDWVVPRAWDVSYATLKVSSPTDVSSPILAEYKNIPCSLMMYSASTPKEGIEAEVVIIDNVEKAKADRINVKDKFILTGRYCQSVLPFAIEGEAAGVICDWMKIYPGIRNTLEEVNDAVRWENNFISPINDTGLFGFNVSPRIGKYLRKLIESNKSVKLHAVVKTHFYNGLVYNIMGKIPGINPNEEIVITSHLYEPGAHDNASGCAILLELPNAIINSIENGDLPQPKRTIRFVLGFEAASVAAYDVLHPERVARTIEALELDMMGAGAQEKVKLHIFHNPLSNWSVSDTLLPALYDAYKEYSKEDFYFDEKPYIINNNLLADPMIGVPHVALLMSPALSYHTSWDTIDKLDIKVLKRNALITGAAILFLSCPHEDDIYWLLNKLKSHATREINRQSKNNILTAYLMSKAFINAYKQLLHLSGHDKKLATIISSGIQKLSVSAIPTISYTAKKNIVEKAQRKIPHRKIRGSITFHTLPAEVRRSVPWVPFYSSFYNIPLFWTDGQRSLWEIICLSYAESSENYESFIDQMLEAGISNPDTNTFDKYLELMCNYYDFLDKYGYITYNEIK